MERVDVAELIVREVRRQREALERLFAGPGQVVVHVNPQSTSEPVRLEVRVKLG